MQEYRSVNPCVMLSPVPAVMISCKGIHESDRPNIITVAWAGTVNTVPPMVSISIRPQRHSYELIVSSGEFVVNLVDQANFRKMDWCGVKSGRDYDKFLQTGLTQRKAKEMQYAPAIDECPASLSCKVRQVVPLGSHHMIIGQVVAVEIKDSLFDEDGGLHLQRANLVCYNHGVYQKVTDVIGFFGCSVARPDVFKKRMAPYWAEKQKEYEKKNVGKKRNR